MPHYLIVGDFDPDTDDREWEIEHEPSCPEHPPEPTGQVDANGDQVMWPPAFRCKIGVMVGEMSDDAFGGQEMIDQLAPGRYELEFWTSHQPSTPNGPAEWDAGITIVVPE